MPSSRPSLTSFELTAQYSGATQAPSERATTDMPFSVLSAAMAPPARAKSPTTSPRIGSLGRWSNRFFIPPVMPEWYSGDTHRWAWMAPMRSCHAIGPGVVVGDGAVVDRQAGVLPGG